MATGGGAWQSEYFDKGAGPGGHQDASSFATEAAPTQATPPAMYNVRQPSQGRGTIIVTVVLRVLTCLFALVGFGVLVSSQGQAGITFDDGTQAIDTIHFGVLSGLKYLFAAFIIVVVYSVIMMIIGLVACLCASALANNKILLWITLLCDQVTAYILISAGAAAANAVMMSKNDQNVTGVPATLSCSDLGVNGFCNKAAASVGLGFVAFLLLAITALISSRRAFRL